VLGQGASRYSDKPAATWPFCSDSKGDYEGAQPLYERALEARERVLGKEHPDTLAKREQPGRFA
jgi:hypothetical protein